LKFHRLSAVQVLVNVEFVSTTVENGSVVPDILILAACMRFWYGSTTIFGAILSCIIAIFQELVFQPASVTTTWKLLVVFISRVVFRIIMPLASVVQLDISVAQLYISASIQLSVVIDTFAQVEFV